jgi:hypothetical protein
LRCSRLHLPVATDQNTHMLLLMVSYLIMATPLHSFIHYAQAKYMLWCCKYMKLRHSCWHIGSWQFMAVHSQLTQQVCCTTWSFVAVHSEPTGLLHQLPSHSSTLWTDTMPAAPSGHIQHWHLPKGCSMLISACQPLVMRCSQYGMAIKHALWLPSSFNSVLSLMQHTALTQRLLHQLTIYGSTPWSVTIGLLHQVATYSSIHCSDTMPAAPAGNLWQYTLNWQQVCCTSCPLTTVHFALTQYASGEKPCLV